MIKKIERLRELEQRRLDFESVKKDITNYYYKEGAVSFQITTNAHTRNYDSGTPVKFTLDLMNEYLEKEIKNLEIQIRVLISQIGANYSVPEKEENPVEEIVKTVFGK